MSTTTFSGPVRAGTDRESATANVGRVILAQSFNFVQSTTGTASGVRLPANSEIIDFEIKITTACDGGTQNFSMGTNATATQFFSALALGTANNTIFFGSSGTIATALWETVGTADVQLFTKTSAGTLGRGIITVQYVQK